MHSPMITPSFFFIIVLLGLVEGFTEFLPVSSTGHLIVLGGLFRTGTDIFENGLFEVFIQTGAILAVFVLYRQKFLEMLKNPLSRDSIKIAINVFIGSLPIIIGGLFLYNFIMESLFKNIFLIAVMLILGGFAFLWIERKELNMKTDRVRDMSWKQALGVGLFQVLALIPGTSRSGATIFGGLLCGLSRKAAAEFSFFVAVPVILGASFLGLIKNFSDLNTDMCFALVLGFLVSFISSLIFIKWFIDFISKRTFTVFGYYRIILGLLILFML